MYSYQRVQYLRKTLLNLSQEEFSQKINVSRPNLGNIERGRTNLTERVFNDICREFSINPEWLIDGKEPIFIDGNDNLLQEISYIYKFLSDDSKKYLRGYVDRLIDEQINKK